ncbi:MAG: deoxyribodipyrimidine photo-lyase, partial [Acidimicrobiia bacterium]|nr:deoxyribodipyrimidine photo-lyase [Acidimicrobiia bacterium]
MSGVVWFRRDLRLIDNPAWADATALHDEVLALFVLDPALLRPGSRRTNLLLHHLHALDDELRERGGRLHVRSGDPTEVVPAVATEAQAGTVHWNRDVTPFSRRRDTRVREALDTEDRTWWGSHVHPPGTVLTGSGTTYKVFTPFYRTWSATDGQPDPTGGDAAVVDDPADGLPTPTADTPMEPGASAAISRLEAYAQRAAAYADERDDPALDATSRLSADL